MNVLFVTEKFPLPLDSGGNVRTYNLLKGLASEHDVTLISGTQGDVQEGDVKALSNVCRVEMVDVPRTSAARDYALLLRSLTSNSPFVLTRHAYPAMRQRIATTLNNGVKYDAVHFNHLDSALYRDAVPAGVSRVLDQHNIVTNQVKTTLASEASAARRMILRHEHRKMQRFEPEVCAEMDRCLVCSDADATFLEKLGVPERAAVIPNGVDLEYFRPIAQPPAKRDTMAFLGAIDYDPCEKAVWYCCQEILPRIRLEQPDIRFTVVGRNPSARLRAFAAADPALQLTGRVEDVRPYVQGAAVFIVPLLSGSGTRLKILEAMAMGVPVVSTSIGIEGLDAVHGKHAWIADEPETLAAGVLHLLRNVDAAESLRREGRRLVEDHYGWPAVRGKLLDEYRALSDRRRSGS